MSLVRLNLDLIVAGNTSAALAAKAATTTSDRCAVMGDPVADGLVVSLAALPAISRVAARRSRDKSEPLITEGVAAEPSLVHRSFARLRIASGMRRQ
jgi:hypothetical protein